jgi:hypothetical protein
MDELQALLDESPELIDQVNDRGMTALMSAAHGGHAAVVTMLLERGADVTCRDDRGVSALDYAIRENKQEVARALLDCGAKVDALKKGLNIESATMLAKIGAEKGIHNTTYVPRTRHTRFILMLATCNAYRAHRHGSEVAIPRVNPGSEPVQPPRLTGVWTVAGTHTDSSHL